MQDADIGMIFVLISLRLQHCETLKEYPGTYYVSPDLKALQR
jgi:hypothetical protein